ncbi:unnamed protein product [Prorocentrum cordatum]|uniref:Uncharacterized protein n=1 Tax=Prorocentrum cordatum TaxID=2364126 RepID=A0ABN9RII1_9DINO|nr:unnamed protein product [Polarella glacialis]
MTKSGNTETFWRYRLQLLSLYALTCNSTFERDAQRCDGETHNFALMTKNPKLSKLTTNFTPAFLLGKVGKLSTVKRNKSRLPSCMMRSPSANSKTIFLWSSALVVYSQRTELLRSSFGAPL